MRARTQNNFFLYYFYSLSPVSRAGTHSFLNETSLIYAFSFCFVAPGIAFYTGVCTIIAKQPALTKCSNLFPGAIVNFF